jgi:alpha-1,2-mannosyltransferase
MGVAIADLGRKRAGSGGIDASRTLSRIPREYVLPVVACLVLFGWFGWVDPIPHYDIAVFLRGASAVLAGHDPYPRPGTPAVYSGFAFVYPYLVAWPFVPLGALPRSVGEDVFIAASVVAIIAGCRLMGVRHPAVYALVLTTSCTIVGLQMGSLNAVLFCGVAAAWRYRDRPFVVVPLLALVIVSKVFLAPLCLWPLLAGRRITAAAAAALTAVILGAGWVFGPLTALGYDRLLSALGAHEAPFGMSATGLLLNVGAGMSLARAVASLLAVAVVIVTAWHGRRVGDEQIFFTGCLAATLIASPIVWSHYLLLLTVPLLIRRDGVDQPEPAGPIAAAAVFSWLVVTPHHTEVASVVVGMIVVVALAATAVRPRQAGAMVRLRSAATRLGPWPAVIVGGVVVAFVTFDVLAATYARHGGAVVGAFCAQLALLAVLVRAWRLNPTKTSLPRPEPAAPGPVIHDPEIGRAER